MNDRKPLARLPRSIRYSDDEWEGIREYAFTRGEEPSRTARKLTMYGLSIAKAQAAVEAHASITSARLA